MSYGVKVVAYVLITLFLGVILKELSFKGSRLVLLLGMISVIGATVIYVGELVGSFSELGEGGGEYTVAILKIVGVGYVFGICADVCSELGESALCNAVTLFGRVEIMMICLPFVKMILEKGIALL